MKLRLRMLWKKWRERIAMKVAWLLPRWLVYWAAIRLITHATQGLFSSTVVPELEAMEALRRWEVSYAAA